MNILLLFLLCVTNAENDTTGGKVFDALADYALAIESLESGKYAAVCRIKQTTLSSSLGPNDHKRIWVAVKLDRNKTLQARCVEQVSRGGRVFETWSQRLTDGGKTAFRLGRLDETLTSDMLEKDVEKEKLYEKMKRSNFRSVQPFEMVACMPVSVQDGFPRTSRTYFSDGLLKNRLVIAKMVDGDIHGKWQIPTANGYSPTYGQVEIVFGKDVDYLPISLKRTATFNDGKSFLQTDYINTTWEKVQGRFMPKTIQVVVHLSGNEFIYNISSEWKLDEKVPSNLIDLDARDWLEPTRKLFDESWQRKGFALPFLLDKGEG